MKNILTKFGKQVKEVRLNKTLSQGKLAKILKVHPTYISAIERGLRNLSLKKIEKLSKALNVSVVDLLK